MADTSKNSYKLLGILQSYAPNAEAQQKCADFYNEMVADNNSEAYLMIAMLNAIKDWIEYGNAIWRKI